jgi:hypothetical protein
MWRVEGGYMMNEAGYTRLAEEAARLQLAERTLTARVAELEAQPVGVAAPLAVVAVLSLVAGLVAGVYVGASLPR